MTTSMNKMSRLRSTDENQQRDAMRTMRSKARKSRREGGGGRIRWESGGQYEDEEKRMEIG